MNSSAASLLALVPMVLHSILGCCWHHQHDGDRAGVTVVGRHAHEHFGPLMSHSPAGAHGGGGHRHDCGDAGEEHPAGPCRHLPCDEPQCVVGRISDAAVNLAPGLLDDAPEWVRAASVELMLPNSTPPVMRADGRDRVLPGSAREHCALRQVWLI